MKTFKSILEFQKHFNTEEKCLQFFEQQRWGNEPACVHCGSVNVTRLKNGKRFQCNEKPCRNKFSVTSGTILHGAKIPLQKVLLALYILSNHSKGISSLQLASWLDTSQKTAWLLNHKIRQLLKDNTNELLSGIVEVDESFIGGKVSNKHVSKRKELGKFDNKTMVVAALEREGKVVTQIVPDTTKESLVNFVNENIEKGSIMVTDENPSYNTLKKDYKHVTVNHSKEQYVVGAGHVNSVEGFWNLLKKQINGIHHSVSKKHLSRYCDEASFRYNHKGATQDVRFQDALLNKDRRLKYTDLTK